MIQIMFNQESGKYALRGSAAFADWDKFLNICINGLTAKEVYIHTETLSADELATIQAILEGKGIAICAELTESQEELAQVSEKCPRCGGSGNYSYNALHGTVCYGCQGKGWVPKKAKSKKRHKKVELKDAGIGDYVSLGKNTHRVDGWLSCEEGFTRIEMGPMGRERVYYRRALLLTRMVDYATPRLLQDAYKYETV